MKLNLPEKDHSPKEPIQTRMLEFATHHILQRTHQPIPRYHSHELLRTQTTPLKTISHNPTHTKWHHHMHDRNHNVRQIKRHIAQ